MVTQENYLFSGTIADNIRFGRPSATMDEVVAATTALGAHDFISAMPDGYDTDVANSGGRLSAGQRQLVAFARAFLADPAVLILDEATSSLDVPSERLVQHALRTVLAGRTAVIIAHRLSTVEIADRVLVMEHGRIVEDGSPADLIAGGDGRFTDLHEAWLESPRPSSNASGVPGTPPPCCGCRTAPSSTSGGCPAGNGPRSAGCTGRSAGSGIRSGPASRSTASRATADSAVPTSLRLPGVDDQPAPSWGTAGCRAAHSLTSRRSAGRGVPSASDRSTSDHTASRSARASVRSSDGGPRCPDQLRLDQPAIEVVRACAAVRGETRAGRRPWRPGRARGCPSPRRNSVTSPL